MFFWYFSCLFLPHQSELLHKCFFKRCCWFSPLARLVNNFGHSFGLTRVPVSVEALKASSHVVAEHVFENLGSLCCTSLCLYGQRIKFEKHETSLFLLTSESARFVIATANNREVRTRS